MRVDKQKGEVYIQIQKCWDISEFLSYLDSYVSYWKRARLEQFKIFSFILV